MTLYLLASLCAVLSGSCAYSAIRAVRTGWVAQYKPAGCDRERNPRLFFLGVAHLGFFAAGAAIGAVFLTVAASRPENAIPLRQGWPLVALLGALVLGNLVYVRFLEPFNRANRHRLESMSPWSFWSAKEVHRIVLEMLEERQERRKRGT